MWTTETRIRHDRSKRRYPSDVTDDEWVLVKPMIPPAKRGGRKREHDERGSGQWPPVCAQHRLPVAVYPEGYAIAALSAAPLRPPVAGS